MSNLRYPGKSNPKHSQVLKDDVARLWETGLSAAKIGDRLGLTKGQVMGIKGRLGLPNRGVPASLRRIKSKPPSQPAEEPREEREAVLAPAPRQAVRTLLGLPGAPRGCTKTCQWFERDNDGPFFDKDKCGQPSLAGRSYCAEHAVRSVCSPKEAARILRWVA